MHLGILPGLFTHYKGYGEAGRLRESPEVGTAQKVQIWVDPVLELDHPESI